MTAPTDALETEIRRLRMRIIGLDSRRLDEPGGGPDTGAVPEPSVSSRRETIVTALAELSAIGSGGREVPDLGDASLADQVVVLLDHGRRVAETLPEAGRDEMLVRLRDAAVGLRRRLA